MTIRVHALQETDWLKPDGDCYAPQIMLANDRYDVNTIPLNAEMIPVITERQLADAYRSLGRDDELTARWARIVTGCNVLAVGSTGFSQGDYGTVFVFAPPEWLEMTGAPGITPEDANDLSAWVWGDVYEVVDTEDADNNYYVYGMDEAMKIGEITFPTHHSYLTYDYGDGE